MKSYLNWTTSSLFFSLAACSSISVSEPLFPNSVVSHDIDLIYTSDPTVNATHSFIGKNRREMPDKRRDELFDNGTFVFTLNYEDKTTVDVWAHSDFSTEENASSYLQPIKRAIGKLPMSMRDTLNHVVLHKGNETAFAEHLGHFFVLYSDNVETRIKNNDFEETIFHESVHATLDYKLANNSDWTNAQKLDGAFVTEYAAKNPKGEDLAESALFAYSLHIDNNRLPENVKKRLESTIPNRLAYLAELFDDL